MRYITNNVFLGQFVRGMHKWGSSVMVILVFLHMGRTFFFGAYKYPRELNWVIGVVLLILTMLMAFTGYLLPFDQRSYWATIVGVNINGTGPLLGPYLSDFLRGGPEFSATTLSRFYSIHMLLIPGAIAADRRPPLPRRQARHDGSAVAGSRAPCRPARGGGMGRAAHSQPRSRGRGQRPDEPAPEGGVPPRVLEPEGKGKPFFPYAVAKDAAMGCVVMAVIITLSLVLGAELGSKANAATTTYMPRPEWYFFFLFEVLRVIKPPSLVRWRRSACRRSAMILLFLLPFYDRGPERHPERRPIATITGIAVICMMAYLTYQGANAGSPTAIELAAPASVVAAGGSTLAEYEAGKLVVAQSGCLACHKIGDNGNAGPGPNLTHIGARLPRLGIARTLVNPTAPMPSFKNLPPQKFTSVVNFLSQLK